MLRQRSNAWDPSKLLNNNSTGAIAWYKIKTGYMGPLPNAEGGDVFPGGNGASDGGDNLIQNPYFFVLTNWTNAENVVYNTNTAFATDTVWTKGTGWTIPGNGTAVGTSTPTNSSLTQPCVIVGNEYRVTVVVSAASAGLLYMRLGSTTSSGIKHINGTGTFTWTGVCAGNTDAGVIAAETSSFTITSITITPTYSISNNTLVISTVHSGAECSQDCLVLGETYNVTVKVATATGGSLGVYLGTTFCFTINGTGTFTCNDYGCTDNTKFRIVSAEANSSFTIDSVIVKPTTQSKWMSSGIDITTNGGFDADKYWTKGTGWTITGGKAVLTNATSDISQAILTIGQTYKVTVVVSVATSGLLYIKLGTTSSSGTTNINGVGTWTFTGSCVGNTNLVISAAEASTFQIDSVTCVILSTAKVYDATGLGYPITNSTAATQPILNLTGSPIGTPCLDFNGTSQFLAYSGTLFPSALRCVIMACKWTDNSSGTDQLFFDANTANKGMSFGYNYSQTTMRMDGSSQYAGMTGSTWGSGTNAIAEVFFSTSASRSCCTKNGYTRTLTTCSTTGIGIKIARQGTTSAYYAKLSVYEIILMYRDFVGTERMDLIRYLSRTWGIPLT